MKTFSVKINRKCRCINGSIFFNLIEGNLYWVSTLFQMPDGRLMVQMVNDEHDQVLDASRFELGE